MENNKAILRSLSTGAPIQNAQVARVVEVREQNVEKIMPSGGKATEGTALNVENLKARSEKYVTFDITNNDAVNDFYILIGTPVGNGNKSKFGISQSLAFDSADVSDDFGANCPKIQGFNELVSRHTAVLSKITVFTSDATQKLEGITPVDLELDLNDRQQTKRLPATNTEENYVRWEGVMPASSKSGFLYKIVKGKSVQIELVIMAEAEIELFE